MIELIGEGRNFYFYSIYLFIYLFIYFCLNYPPCRSPPGGRGSLDVHADHVQSSHLYSYCTFTNSEAEPKYFTVLKEKEEKS